MDDYDLQELEEIMDEGFARVECSAGCGHSAVVEPDADYECPCGGRLTSPLIKLGLI